MNAPFKLVYKGTNVIVSEGSVHKSSRGELWTYCDPLYPHKPSSTGKVSMRLNEDWTQIFYPQVFGLEFVTA